jgi:glycosyltransferase involved in cell wall biosynthesis
VTRRPRCDVVFLTHELSRTGAPAVLVAFVSWLVAHTSLRVEVVTLHPGPLAAELPPSVRVTRWDDWHGHRLFWLGIRLLRRLGYGRFAHRLHRADIRRRLRNLFSARLLYVNSVVPAFFARDLPFEGPVVAHVHEIGLGLRWRTDDVRWLLGRSTRVVACSNAVRDDLLALAGDVLRTEIDVVHEPLVRPPRALARADARAALGLPESAYVVGGCGTIDWRKGYDLFVQLARRLRDEPDLLLVWLGGELDSSAAGRLRHDAELAGVADRIRLLGTLADPAPFFAALDAFVMTSREDPYPLVCLEAAANDVPIAWWPAGGIGELLAPDAGVEVPYLDVAALADAVRGLRADPVRAAALGRVAHGRLDASRSLDETAAALAATVRDVLRDDREPASLSS